MVRAYKRLHALLDRREKRNFYILVGLMIIEALVEVVGIGLIPVFVTTVAYPDKLNDYAFFAIAKDMIAEEYLQAGYVIYVGSFIMLLFFLGKTVFFVLNTYLKTSFIQNRALSLSHRLFSAYLNAPYAFHLKYGSNELIRNINTECMLLSNMVLWPMIDIISQSIILFGVMLILAFILPGQVLALVAAFIAISMFSIMILNKLLKSMGKDAQNTRAYLLKTARESLEGVKEIKILWRMKYFSDLLLTYCRRLSHVDKVTKTIQLALPSWTELLAIIGLLGVTVMLFATGEEGKSIIPVLSVVVVALVRIKSVMRAIMHDFTEIKHGGASLDTVYEGFQMLRGYDSGNFQAVKNTDYESSERLDFSNVIELTAVSYKYPDTDIDALRNIDLSISKGESVGIVGTTGAGKSTLADLLLGVLDPTAGKIAVDGRDIRRNMRAWQMKIGYIPQMIFLIEGTVKENIALGTASADVDRQRLEQVVRTANLTGLINKLASGMDTLIGEKGVRLSGGERQRIIIARALYNNPEVLIMDEATSALDNVTEKEIIKEIELLKGERTILIIAHRLSTVRRCDRILFIKEGEIDAIGSYEELARTHAEFMRMTEVM